MKKIYVTPVAEKINFEYKDQVVAASGNCTKQWTNIGDDTCKDFEWVRTFELS